MRRLPELVTDARAQRAHNAALDKGFPLHIGDVAYSDRVAIYLIYQKGDLPESIIETCSHFRSKGYAPFVISNAPLAPHDIERLKPVTWRTMERPNFGYDFGGYRDGVLCLRTWNIDPEYLCILNDSVWFPIYDTETLIETCETRTDGVSGPILTDRGEVRFLESYFYMIPRDVWHHRAFTDFWANLRLTSNKYVVIRRGERRFSEVMEREGIPLYPAYHFSDFLSAIEDQDDFFLREMLRLGRLTNGSLDKRRIALAEAEGASWRTDAMQLVHETVPATHPYVSYPYAMSKLMQYPILKKSGDWGSRQWRRAMSEAWRTGKLAPPKDVVLSELDDFPV
ncbi:MAG: rhamnan synthesis F family protein [Pseudomonadota bacterium]